jgi:3-methylfumaryl-CoA hydratase
VEADRVVRTEVLSPEPSEALANLLGTDRPATHLPPMWHWVHLLERRPHADLGPDGHPSSGVPAPPGPGRKRMFAGGRMRTASSLRIGQPATRTTWVEHTVDKQGRSGPLTFVTVRTEIAQDGAVAVVEEADVVYRAADSTLSGPAPAEADAPAPDLTLRVDPAFLFRFSALTYNAHRIHYDLEWARHEGYTGLVVHGPLQALMMAELFRRRGDRLVGRTFDYRLRAPMVGPQTFGVSAVGADGAEVRDAAGRLTATATLSA